MHRIYEPSSSSLPPMCVSCCYLFRCKARNIYSPIDYISISLALYVSLFTPLRQRSHRIHFYYHEKISCLWCWSDWGIQWPTSMCFSSISLSSAAWHWIKLCWMKKKTKCFGTKVSWVRACFFGRQLVWNFVLISPYQAFFFEVALIVTWVDTL